MSVVFQPENPLMQVVELITTWSAFFDVTSFDIGVCSFAGRFRFLRERIMQLLFMKFFISHEGRGHRTK